MPEPIDFTPVRHAQLGATDLCMLAGVGRVAASHWLNNHTQPHSLIAARVAKLVDDIATAVEAGLLPVPHHVMRRERGLYIKTAIERATAGQ